MEPHPIEIDDALPIKAPTTVHGSYVDHSTMRILGRIIVVTTALGAPFAAYATTSQDNVNGGTYAVIALAGAVVITGFVMMFQYDRVEVRLAPLVVPPPTSGAAPGGSPDLRAVARDAITSTSRAPEGLVLEMRF
jgi:hypothetical protein